MDSSSSPRMYEPHGASPPSTTLVHNDNRNMNKLGPSPPTALKVKNFPNGANNSTAGGAGPGGGGELAELTSNEISLDLQGLIDDTPFGDDDNLFGDLIEAKKNELNHGYGLHNTGMSRTSPTTSLGSSGHNSPGATSTDSSGNGSFQYRPPAHIAASTLAYMPGSVHSGAGTTGYVSPPQQSVHSTPIQVKQEPGASSQVQDDYRNSQSYPPNVAPPGAATSSHSSSSNNTPASTNNNNNSSSSVYSNGTVSSTTPTCGAPGYPSNLGSAMPSLKSFATPPKYLTQPIGHSGGSKKKVDRNSEEYRRRRERNNVAVRKSREKAKARTKETEERVKILARDNERLLKKMELLQEEVTVLRSLFSNVGVLPEHIHRELSKHMENFQAQHNAMACM